MMDAVIELVCLNEREALELLRSFDDLFHPCLSSRLDIEAFATKLSLYANWILCRQEAKIVAYMAFYRNDETHIDYITSYCEIPADFENLGNILSYLINNTPSSIWETRLRCRKVSVNDIQFYKAHQFEIIEDQGDNLILRRLNIKK